MTDQRITFTLPGNPIPWHRSKQTRTNRIDGKHTRFYKDKADVKYQDALAMHAMHALQLWTQAFKKPWDASGEFRVEVAFHVHDLRRKDIDNLFKQIGDALNNVVWDDDNQIVSLSAKKVLNRERPHVIVTINRVHGYLEDRAMEAGLGLGAV